MSVILFYNLPFSAIVKRFYTAILTKTDVHLVSNEELLRIIADNQSKIPFGLSRTDTQKRTVSQAKTIDRNTFQIEGTFSKKRLSKLYYIPTDKRNCNK